MDAEPPPRSPAGSSTCARLERCTVSPRPTPDRLRLRTLIRLPSSLACLALAAACANAETTYLGAKACAGCHPAQFQRQSASGHAQALFRTPEHPLTGAFMSAGTLTRKPNYRFEFFLSGSALQTRIRDASDVMLLPMEWAFGMGAQAVTFVSKVDKDWYVEHYSSYYPGL